MIQEEDLPICHTCMNRLYNAKNELLCGKKLDNSNIQFFCSGFLPEEVYEDKEFLTKEDRAENSKRKINTFFSLIAAFYLIIMIAIVFSDKNDIAHGLTTLISLLIGLLLFLAIYKGKRWAKRLNNILYSVTLFRVLISLGTDIDDYMELLLNVILILFIVFVLYFINADRDFRRHFKLQSYHK
ncbi:MAG: hypothetical protein PHR83_14370 [Paludibacter sp.]|nr:hypothetical protein [Paludibacter sp.]